jgi:cell shape-determining protein MreD
MIGLLLNQCNQVMIVERAHFKALIVLIVYVSAELLAYWLGLLKGRPSQGSYYSMILFTGLYSAIIAPVVWSMLASLSGGMSQRTSRNHRMYP